MTATRERAEEFLRLLERLRRLPQGGPNDNPLVQLGLSHSHIRAMGVLRCTDAMPMKDLADRLEMTPPSVTSLTRRLTALKLLERQTDPDDSRRVLVCLTRRGSQLFENMHRHHVDSFEKLLSGLSDADQQHFLDLMVRAVDTLARSVGAK